MEKKGEKEKESEGDDKTEEEDHPLMRKAQNSFTIAQEYGRDRILFSIAKDVFMLFADIATSICGVNPYLYDCSKLVAVGRRWKWSLKLEFYRSWK